jgi:hypothetical protein
LSTATQKLAVTHDTALRGVVPVVPVIRAGVLQVTPPSAVSIS